MHMNAPFWVSSLLNMNSEMTSMFAECGLQHTKPFNMLHHGRHVRNWNWTVLTTHEPLRKVKW